MFVPLRTTHQVGRSSILASKLLTRSPARLGTGLPLSLVTGRQPLRFGSDEARPPSRPPSSAVDSSLPYPPYTIPTKGILSKLPPSWVPYAELSRIEKPGGLYGFYMAYLIGLGYGSCLVTPAVAPGHLAQIAGVLLVYNVFLRGAACTVNDILDRDYDRQVARCRNRPVARRAVTPSQGYMWYAAQTVGAGAAIACLPSPMLALAYAVPIQLSVSLYPLAKRHTDFPQLVLSAPIAGGVLMAAASLGMDPFTTSATGFLFMSHYIWTTIFDYVNACQDTADDIKAGVRSMAVRYQNTSLFISTLGAAQVGCLAATGILAGFSPVYMIGAVGGNALWLATMVMTVKRTRPDICAWWFSWGGLLVSGTTVAALFAEYHSRLDGSEGGEKINDSK
ncbi:UbiA prenyltransferase family-domain-containing protein [Emericellopsis atlantica]|uniref:UbiA prenyltransferase family-domain-containing protein n=1 Tax=Emericellopsis atlantica TaxID=2614577 RepID=A0A9P7ZII0_9HYPO|nr:UbiA prenyltransferase family-domain-containing protein [Emericellopsis atlantica]KAG9252366.1 UbiA prenyltransferase family-domain-containing protein [Emericellopsis atlantica]